VKIPDAGGTRPRQRHRADRLLWGGRKPM